MREDTKPEHRCPACGHRARWPVIRCRACGWQATSAQRGGVVLDLLALVILLLGCLMFGLWCMATDPAGPTCEERGGRQVLTHMQDVGGVLVPFYACRGARR